MANQIISNLTRTLSTYFRFGTLRIKDSSGVLEVRNAGDTANADLGANRIRVKGSNASNAIVLDAPGGLGGSVTFVLPGSDGATGQYLKTNGAGTWSWGDPGSNADKTEVETFNQASSSPLTIYTPAANEVIRQIVIEVTAAAAGGSPTLSIGYAASPAAYMATTEVDLKDAGFYVLNPMVNVGANPTDVIATLVASGQTFSGKIYITHSVPS